jgi:alkylmercury lyase
MGETERLLELLADDKTTDERVLSEAAFHAILTGEPIDQAGLVAATGFAPAEVEALLHGLTGRGQAVVDAGSGRVVGSWGLSLVPTAHQLRIRGRQVFAWCALDAVGIPAGLRENASITSSCHQCGSVVRVEMTAGELRRPVPTEVQVWLTACQAGRSVVGFT